MGKKEHAIYSLNYEIKRVQLDKNKQGRKKNEELKKVEDYYYDEYRYAVSLAKVMSEEERKYQEAVKKQNKNKEQIEVNYTKEDEINLMVEGIETYFRCYKLPPLRTKSYEWDFFFDTLYNEFEDRRIEEEYYHAVSRVIRYTLANALVNEVDKINISNFIDNLKYLCKTNNNEGILPDYFGKYDVVLIQSRINGKIRLARNKAKEAKQYKRVYRAGKN